jgi:ankyrin repeat protein
MLEGRATSSDHAAALAGLRVAIEGDLAEVVEVYLQAGVELNRQDSSGLTPLIVAASAGRIGMVRRLLAAGGSVDFAAFDGMTALHHAALRDDLQMLEMLVEHGADLTCRNCEGKTAIDLARVRQFSVPSLGVYGTHRRVRSSASAKYLRRLVAHKPPT